jgi:hypothetical protein
MTGKLSHPRYDHWQVLKERLVGSQTVEMAGGFFGLKRGSLKRALIPYDKCLCTAPAYLPRIKSSRLRLPGEPDYQSAA